MTDTAAFTLPDFLKRFGISRSGFYRELHAGRIKARKRGRSTIILAADAQAWLDSLPEMTANKAA